MNESSAHYERHNHWHEMPMVRCPHCSHEFQWDDYYDIEVGRSKICGKCEKTIYVAEVYTAMHVRLSRESEDD